MHPELITLPGGFTIKMYGFCLMVGFLSAVWLAMRRAARVRVDADRVLDLSFLLLLAGVAGARLFYVVHYWQTQFADRPNRLLAVIDIRQGGLEFLGGLLGALLVLVAYLLIKKQSIRLFLDILAPSLMWGVAFGRIGCFLNGCCFGGLCAAPGMEQKPYAWAIEFPFGSPAQMQQWEDRQMTVPAELLITSKADLSPWLVPGSLLTMSPERRDGPRRAYLDAKKAHDRASDLPAEPDTLARLKAEMETARQELEAHAGKLASLMVAQRYPSRSQPDRKAGLFGQRTLVSELQDLAQESHSIPVHPVQLYATVNALLLSALLSVVFYRRKRHGVVIGLLFVLYPIARVLEETLRIDNPADVFGLTVSQALSIALFAGGIAYLFILYTRLPERSPYADAASAPTKANAA